MDARRRAQIPWAQWPQLYLGWPNGSLVCFFLNMKSICQTLYGQIKLIFPVLSSGYCFALSPSSKKMTGSSVAIISTQ